MDQYFPFFHLFFFSHAICLSDKNINDIKTFVENGGKAIICGDFGEFDVMYGFADLVTISLDRILGFLKNAT